MKTYQQINDRIESGKAVEDVDSALERIAAINGIDGVLIVKDDRVGLAGKLPPLVKVY